MVQWTVTFLLHVEFARSILDPSRYLGIRCHIKLHTVTLIAFKLNIKIIASAVIPTLISNFAKMNPKSGKSSMTMNILMIFGPIMNNIKDKIIKVGTNNLNLKFSCLQRTFMLLV